MKNWTGLYDGHWWLEHLEGEMDPALRVDMDLLLENSQADRAMRKELEELRAAVKDSDGVVLPEDGNYYERMHDQIMAAIAEEPAAPAETASKEWAASVLNTEFLWRIR